MYLSAKAAILSYMEFRPTCHVCVVPAGGDQPGFEFFDRLLLRIVLLVYPRHRSIQKFEPVTKVSFYQQEVANHAQVCQRDILIGRKIGAQVWKRIRPMPYQDIVTDIIFLCKKSYQNWIFLKIIKKSSNYLIYIMFTSIKV